MAGGIRMRLFEITPILTKVSLFKFVSSVVPFLKSSHKIEGAIIADISCVLLHKLLNNQLKEKIRIRDNCECKLCFINQEELNEKLLVHHIDFDKDNNSEFNLISLCRSCHGKINCANKMFWINFFQNRNILITKSRRNKWDTKMIL